MSLARVNSLEEMLALARQWRGEGKSIGFVPTMGALHEGHQSLVRRARGENDVVVVSVFVNPLQFGPSEDFSRYPRDLEADAGKIESAGGDVLLTCEPASMYPDGFSTYVVPEGVASLYEGAVRPGHFRGVLTVVLKLFQIAKPHRAYFGRKDAQQLFLIENMVRDLHLDLQVVPCPTLREPDGLAMSSRNVYLSGQERKTAAALSRALRTAKERFGSGEREVAPLLEEARRVLGKAAGLCVDYLVLVDPRSFRECSGRIAHARMLVAARVGKTRLIDNMWLGEEEER